MDDSHTTLRSPSLCTQPPGRSVGYKRWASFLANQVLLATLASSSSACPPSALGAPCKHTIGHPSSHVRLNDCRPIGTWTMVQGPNSFPSCDLCGCVGQSNWPLPYSHNPPSISATPNSVSNSSTSPQALSQPSNDSATLPPGGKQPIQQDRTPPDQPKWRPPTGQVPTSPLPSPDVPASDPTPPKAPSAPEQKADEDPLKKLELLFGDPPPAAPTPTGDASQSRWLPRTTNPQGNNLPNSYVNAPISRGTSLPLGQQEWRTWTDHTGTFQVRAALIEVGAHHLVLLKENGRTTTLPISRLSPQDAVYLRRGK